MYIFNYKPPINCHGGNPIFTDSIKLPEPVIVSNGSLINNRSDYNSPALSSILGTTESVHCCNIFSIMVAHFPFGRKRDAVLFSMPLRTQNTEAEISLSWKCLVDPFQEG